MKAFGLGFVGGLMVLGASMAHGEASISFQTEVQPKEIYIGDPLQMQVTVTMSSNVQPAALTPPAALGDFELLAFQSSPVEKQANGQQIQKHILGLTTFSTGTLTLPGLSLAFSEKGGAITEQKTPDLSIKVKSLLEEKGDIGNLSPLKGLVNFRSYLWAWILLGLILAGMVGYFLVRWNLKRRGLIAAPALPPRPPHETAWEALNHLEEEDLISQGLVKEFYDRLSQILRHYLEGRYAISAMDKTSGELLQEFRQLQLSFETMTSLRVFLDNSDLVKFAKFTPSPEDIADDLNRIKNFLNLTMPRPAEPAPTEDPAAEKIPL